jgi:hypothetical protein
MCVSAFGPHNARLCSRPRDAWCTCVQPQSHVRHTVRTTTAYIDIIARVRMREHTQCIICACVHQCCEALHAALTRAHQHNNVSVSVCLFSLYWLNSVQVDMLIGSFCVYVSCDCAYTRKTAGLTAHTYFSTLSCVCVCMYVCLYVLCTCVSMYVKLPRNIDTNTVYVCIYVSMPYVRYVCTNILMYVCKWLSQHGKKKVCNLSTLVFIHTRHSPLHFTVKFPVLKVVKSAARPEIADPFKISSCLHLVLPVLIVCASEHVYMLLASM